MVVLLAMTTTHHVFASDCFGLEDESKDRGAIPTRKEGSLSLPVAFPVHEVKEHGQRRAVVGETRPLSLFVVLKTHLTPLRMVPPDQRFHTRERP